MTRVHSVVIGLVHSLDDPESLGRIKIQFPWMDSEFVSGWAPVAAPLAGASRGFWFMPELDDEVLVAFEHGDVDHPFVLGYLWNGHDAIPETNPNKRTLVTPGGHTLRFEDEAGARQIVLETDGGHSIVLSDSADGTKLSLTTSGGHQVVLDDQNMRLLVQSSSGQKLEIDDAAQSVTLFGGGRSIKLSAGQVAIT